MGGDYKADAPPIPTESVDDMVIDSQKSQATDTTASETLSDSDTGAECQWIDALVNDPPSTGCTLDAAMHAAALEPGTRVSVRLPNVSRLVGLSNSFIADDEPTGATFVQLLTGAELWPVPEQSYVMGDVDPTSANVSEAELAITPAGGESPSEAGERFITRMSAYPLLKRAGMLNATTRSPAGIESLVAPYLASLNPNEPICPRETRRGTCNDPECEFQHLSKRSAKELAARLLDCFPENDREALVRYGAAPEAMLQHLARGGPPRLDSLLNASARRWNINSSQKSVYALRNLARKLAEFVRLPETTSYAAQLLLHKRIDSRANETIVQPILREMFLDANGRLDERSDKALAWFRDAVKRDPDRMAWWHVYVDLSLLRIPEDDIGKRRDLLKWALTRRRKRSPVLWWKALAIERHSGLKTQLGLVRRMTDAILSDPLLHFGRRNYDKDSLCTVHAANVIYATQLLVGQIAGPAAAIRFLCAYLSASNEKDGENVLKMDPLKVGLDDAAAQFKCGVTLLLIEPRFAALLATALAHWMAYGSALPVEGIRQLGGAFPTKAPLVLLPPVAFPRVLRCVAVFQEIASKVAEEPVLLKLWLDSGALLAVALNMVRCGWLHQPGEQLESMFECVGNVMDDSVTYLAALRRQDSPDACDSAVATLASQCRDDAGATPVFRHQRDGMRLWHVLRTILRHETRRRAAGGPDAAASWKKALRSFAAILGRIESASKTDRFSAGSAVAYLLEFLLRGTSAAWAGVPDILTTGAQTGWKSHLEGPMLQTHMAMELVATAREPCRAPVGALLLLGRMLLCASPSKSDEYEANDFVGTRPKKRLPVEWLSVPQFHDLYHIVARRYFEYAFPFSVACVSRGLPTTPRDGLVDCRASCAACEGALAMTQAHREVLLFGADTAPIELVAESCERLLFEAMSHSGVIIEAVGV